MLVLLLNLSPVGTARASALIAIGGDPSLVGWFITLLYGLTSVACFLAWRRSNTAAVTNAASPVGRPESQGWFLILLASVAFGLNKQLDLQTALTRLGRGLARQEGWYPWRREVQLAFMVVVAVTTATLLVAAWRIGRRWRTSLALRLAFMGQVWLMAFYVMRGVSHHHVDAWLGVRLPAGRARDGIEAAGVLVVLLASTAYAARARKQERDLGDLTDGEPRC
jgi:hypothetical protein